MLNNELYRQARGEPPAIRQSVGWHLIGVCLTFRAVATSLADSARKVRQTPFDGFFGAKFDILKPRWLPTHRELQRHAELRHARDPRGGGCDGPVPAGDPCAAGSASSADGPA